ncbi:hypothetical protein RRG08_037714 [Elysia crispata]|uniref:Uncharacterized protein n=1 Tax=Elysia crispata TaxID=231223 RepID=A0AAE1DTU4_9GAST|nr:hypothetical protein RRG08_037714 [Elysia crispata]
MSLQSAIDAPFSVTVGGFRHLPADNRDRWERTVRSARCRLRRSGQAGQQTLDTGLRWLRQSEPDSLTYGSAYRQELNGL